MLNAITMVDTHTPHTNSYRYTQKEMREEQNALLKKKKKILNTTKDSNTRNEGQRSYEAYGKK